MPSTARKVDAIQGVSLTRYLGSVRAFVDTLHADLVTVTSYTRRLQGQDRDQAFGWESILDRARRRAPLVIEHWMRFNQELDGRVYPDDLELPAYGEHHRLRWGFPEACTEILALLERMNRYIDRVGTFDRQDVKLVQALVQEALSFIREASAAAREVALRLIQTAAESQELERDVEPYPLMSRNQAKSYLEQYAAARARFEEEIRRIEVA
jgi:hypothetical protein